MDAFLTVAMEMKDDTRSCNKLYLYYKIRLYLYTLLLIIDTNTRSQNGL